MRWDAKDADEKFKDLVTRGIAQNGSCGNDIVDLLYVLFSSAQSTRGRKAKGSGCIGVDTVLFICYGIFSYANNLNHAKGFSWVSHHHRRICQKVH